jgi:hypothetical protein
MIVLTWIGKLTVIGLTSSPVESWGSMECNQDSSMTDQPTTSDGSRSSSVSTCWRKKIYLSCLRLYGEALIPIAKEIYEDSESDTDLIENGTHTKKIKCAKDNP